jgi:uncharacterized protein (UPF0548 family)
LPAFVSNRQRSPVLTIGKGERKIIVAHDQLRGVAVARDRVLRVVCGDEAVTRRTVGNRIA